MASRHLARAASTLSHRHVYKIGVTTTSTTRTAAAALRNRSSSSVLFSSLSSCQPSCSLVATKIKSTVYDNHQHFLSRGLSSNIPAASEDKSSDDVLIKPPNLFIPPKAKCSPFYGLDRLERETNDDEEEENDDEEDTKDASTDEYDNDDDDDEYYSDEEEDDYDEELYDLNTLKAHLIPRLITPLPERLHVPIINFTSETNPSEEIGTIHLNPHVFGCDPIRVDILQRVVVYQRNKKRGKRFPAYTKTIAEVSGSGRKVRPQKGTGRARAGHSRPPHWRGGAKAHGPKGVAQDYTTKLNKKVRKMGVRMALSQKLLEGNLILVDHLQLPSHKTKVLQKMLNPHGIGGRKGSRGLFLDQAEEDDNDQEDKDPVLNGIHVNFKIASQNIWQVKAINQLGANVYDILKHEKLVMTLKAMQALEARLGE